MLKKLNCIRKCLVREDQKEHDKRRNECTDNDCLPTEVIDEYHVDCFIECNVWPDRFPGTNGWTTGDRNEPNKPYQGPTY